jgi:hypothetical protein
MKRSQATGLKPLLGADVEGVTPNEPCYDFPRPEAYFRKSKNRRRGMMARGNRSVCRYLGVVLAVFVICAAMTTTASAQVYSFSTCGQGGPAGPIQAQCDTAYTGTSLDGLVTVTGGIQSWTVPTTGTYRIEGWGAAGGTQTYDVGYPGGSGAYISGEFDLTAGQTLYFLVGQMGEDTRAQVDNAAPGGGGGTFVYFDALDAFPLIAAGGGGSGARCGQSSDQDGSAGTAGNPSGSVVNGGTGGNGGLNNVGGSSYWAGGGAGWLTDGTGGNNPADNDYTTFDRGAQGGRSPRNGAAGGVRWNDGTDEGGDGGFGGGGGGGSDNMGGGGGGGFSGGGGARYDPCNNEPGGGGGSYNGGANQTNTAGVNTGDGAVVISEAFAAVNIPTISEWGMIILVTLLATLGVIALRRSKGRRVAA